MRRFVAEQNIRHFRQILESETDLSRRSVLTELLAEAEQELADAKREFAELENAARSADADALPVANDYCEQGDVRWSQGRRNR